MRKLDSFPRQHRVYTFAPLRSEVKAARAARFRQIAYADSVGQQRVPMITEALGEYEEHHVRPTQHNVPLPAAGLLTAFWWFVFTQRRGPTICESAPW